MEGNYFATIWVVGSTIAVPRGETEKWPLILTLPYMGLRLSLNFAFWYSFTPVLCRCFATVLRSSIRIDDTVLPIRNHGTVLPS